MSIARIGTRTPDAQCVWVVQDNAGLHHNMAKTAKWHQVSIAVVFP
ncbi:hypothetical protein [Pectobacterium brasiliense]|nr:hypothetical protein [Pectobacterium brasiliense]